MKKVILISIAFLLSLSTSSQIIIGKQSLFNIGNNISFYNDKTEKSISIDLLKSEISIIKSYDSQPDMYKITSLETKNDLTKINAKKGLRNFIFTFSDIKTRFKLSQEEDTFMLENVEKVNEPIAIVELKKNPTTGEQVSVKSKDPFTINTILILEFKSEVLKEINLGRIKNQEEIIEDKASKSLFDISDVVTIALVNEKPIEIDFKGKSIDNGGRFGEINEFSKKDGIVTIKIISEGYHNGEYSIYKFPDFTGNNKNIGKKIEIYFMSYNSESKTLEKNIGYAPTIKNVTSRSYNKNELEVAEAIKEEKIEVRSGANIELKNKLKNDDKIYAETSTSESDKIIEAEFLGGKQKIYAYIAKNFQMPDYDGLAGKMTAEITIEKDGAISKVKIVKGINSATKEVNSATDKEFERVLKALPKFQCSALKNGEHIVSVQTIPLTIGSHTDN
ncbi:MAG TPA: hypothetical protein VIV55_00850 [Flavobacterium sp.]